MPQDPEWPVLDFVEPPRTREVPYAQMPFVVGVLVLVGFAAAGAPETLAKTGFLVGLALAVGATLAGLLVPWQRHGYQWLVIIPLIDVLVVAFLRDGVRETFPAVSMLVVVPVLWLAYGFAWWALGLALAANSGLFDGEAGLGWLHAKLLLVIGLSGYHGWAVAYSRKLAAGQGPIATRTLRMLNEVPALAVVLIVVLVVVKPF